MNLSDGNSLIYGIKNISFFLITSLYFTISSAAEINSIESGNLSGLLVITPTFSATETWTNNTSPENRKSNSGFISVLSPGINFSSSSGRIKGYLNYSLNIVKYSGEQSRTSLQNSLNSSTVLEVVDGHGYIDVNAFITQQTISAFSIQTINNSNLNSNKTEVSTYILSPYYRGRLSNFINYEARYSLATTRAKSTDNFSSNDTLASINLNGDEFFGKLSWTLAANQQVVSRNASTSFITNTNINGNIEIDRLNGSLNYPVNDQLILSVTGGQERQNYTSAGKENSWTSGAGINWILSDMTKLAANVQRNPLGKMHSLNFEHRTPRTSWRISDVKSLSLSNNKNTLGFGNNYDLLFIQFSSIEPDPIKRALLVNNYLQTNGINPSLTTINGYLTSGTLLQRTQNISFAILGIRDTITFTAAKSNGRSVGNSTIALDDYKKSNLIMQDGVTIAYSHRLTTDTVLSNEFSFQKVRGDLSSQKSQLKSVNVSTSTRLGNKIYLTLSARHSIASSSSFPYKETAVIGNLAVQF